MGRGQYQPIIHLLYKFVRRDVCVRAFTGLSTENLAKLVNLNPESKHHIHRKYIPYNACTTRPETQLHQYLVGKHWANVVDLERCSLATQEIPS